MTFHLDSHRTAHIKPEMLSGVQAGNGTPHDKGYIRGIAHVRKNRKDDIFMQRRLVQSFIYILEWERGTCTLTKHTQCWIHSALRHFFMDVIDPRNLPLKQGGIFFEASCESRQSQPYFL